MLELPHLYTPRELQLPAWRAMDEFKRVCLVWHRRCGKDKLCFNKLIVKAVERMANYAYYFPTGTLGRRALWENVDVNNGMAVIDHIPPQLLASKPNQTEMKIRLVNGSTIQVLGTDNLAVVGGNYFGTVFSEQSLQNPVAWDLTRPILAENGGWAWFNGTPRGRNHFHRMFNAASADAGWFAQRLTVGDTGYITPEDIAAERRAGMSEDLINQEFYCDFNAANPGAIYARLVDMARQEGRIGSLPIADKLVHTSWDLGAPENTTVWYWQVVGREIRVIDCDTGYIDGVETPTQRVAHMMAKGYSFGKHFLPHDAMQTERSGKTALDGLRAAGLQNIIVLPRTADVWHGINALKGLFPSLVFRSPQCDLGIDALEAYRTRVVELGKIISSEPVHDWSSHPCDALRYMAEAVQAGHVKLATPMIDRMYDDEDKPLRRRGQSKFSFVGR